ncbi:MAG: hypothetical protein AAB436_02170 [Patescibacteria group bacterium]
MSDTVFSQMVEKIIAQQEVIIGPVAVEQAQQVKSLKIDWADRKIEIVGEPQDALDDLVAQYKVLFGQIAVETCKEAVSKLVLGLPASQQPKSLQ